MNPKTIGCCIMALCLFLTAGAQVGHSFALVPLESHKVPVSLFKMTTLVFPVKLSTGIKVSREILAQKVKGVENVLQLKAVKKNFTSTNLNAYGVDGKLYSFELEYAEDPPVLNFAVVNRPGDPGLSIQPLSDKVILAGLPVNESRLEEDAAGLPLRKGFLHLSARRERMQLRLKGIYLKDSLLWLVVSLQNRSFLPYRPEFLQLSIVDRKQVKRMAIQQVSVDPVYEQIPGAVEGEAASFSLGYRPFTVGRNKKLILEIAEGRGGRMIRLEIRGKTVLRTRAVE